MLPIVIPLRAEEDRDWKVQPTPLQPLTIFNSDSYALPLQDRNDSVKIKETGHKRRIVSMHES